jgi:hypothetical protein
VRDLPVDTIRLDDWRMARDLACRIGGPNPSFPPTSSYSEAHYQGIGGALDKLDRYETIFVDSITQVTRLSYRHAEQQPEATSERTGKKDVRATYGLHGRQMMHWLQQLQHARRKNVIFVAVLEKIIDDFNRFVGWRPQLEGGKTGRELPAIVDQIITMQWVDFGDGKPTRAFVCTSPNPSNYPAKDRSGKLDQIEEPHLGKLLAKLLGERRKPILVSSTEQQSDSQHRR